MTKGKPLPSFMPASLVSMKRNCSLSPAWRSCTSVASTGSVGARMAPSSTPAPRGRPSTRHAKAATRATEMAIDSQARRSEGSQRARLKGTGILTPAENREMRTAISVRVSSSGRLLHQVERKQAEEHGPQQQAHAQVSHGRSQGQARDAVGAQAARQHQAADQDEPGGGAHAAIVAARGPGQRAAGWFLACPTPCTATRCRSAPACSRTSMGSCVERRRGRPCG